MFVKLLELLKRLLFVTGYVNSGSYPQPLSPEEEQQCLLLMEQGNKHARDKLICHNMRLVAHVAKKYSHQYDVDDLISIGSIGLIKGVESYSKGKGTALATYLARCIENEMLMTLRSNKRYRNTVSLTGTLGVDNDGNEYTLMDVLAESTDSVFHSVELEVMKDNLISIIKNNLNKREQQIILMRYGIDGSIPLTQLETAEKLKISRSYVSRIETKALAKIRSVMEQ